MTSLAKALYMRPEDVELDKKFSDMGLDSIIGVEWIKALNKKLGTSLKATIVYDHPDIRSFERYLDSQLGQARSPRRQEVRPPRPAPSLRELLLQVQRGEVSVEEASRLHSLMGRTEAGTYQLQES